MAFYNKDETYLGEMSERLIKDRDFRTFRDNFESFDMDSVVQMYSIKLTNDINEYSLKEFPTKEDKANRLYKIGEYLKKIQRLNEMREIQNEKVLESTEKNLGKDNKNPFIITKKEILKEFNIENNLNKKEEIVEMKLAFWENRVTKSLESLKNSAKAKYNVKNNKEKEKTTEALGEIQDRLAIENPNFSKDYGMFLNSEITKEELENTESFKKAKEIIDEKNKETNNNFDLYNVLNIAVMEENIAVSYIEKASAIENIALNNRSINVQYFEDKNLDEFNTVKFTAKEEKFSAPVEVHNKVEEIKKIQEKKDITLEKRKRVSSKTIPNIVLVEFSDEKIKQIENLVEHINDGYDPSTKRIIKQYGLVLGMDVPEIVNNQKSKKDNEFINNLQSKTKNNRNNRYNNRNNRYNNNRYNNKNKKREDYDRGER